MDIAFSVLGWMATAFLLIAFAPQSIKVMKIKSADGISKITFPMVFIGSSMWAIYGSFGGFVQPWICNTVIIIFMIPTVYYIFKENKFWMLFVLTIGFSITLVALVIFILVNIGVMDKINVEWLSWIFIICAGAGTGLSYLPQMLNILKTKKIGNVSTLTLVLVLLGNLCWIAFWSLKFNATPNDYTIIASVIWSIMGFTYQVPVIYLYIKQKYDNNTNISKA